MVGHREGSGESGIGRALNTTGLIYERTLYASPNDSSLNSVRNIALTLRVIHIDIAIHTNLPTQCLNTIGSYGLTLEPPATQPVYPAEPRSRPRYQKLTVS